MHKIVVKGPKIVGQFIFELDDNGIVRSFHNEADLTTAQLEWLSTNFPITLDKINDMILKGLIEAKLIEADLSFDHFYKTYNYSVGKIQANRMHDKLSEADKLVALENIKAYEYFLMITGQAKMYPATYLNPKNRHFETNYYEAAKQHKAGKG